MLPPLRLSLATLLPLASLSACSASAPEPGAVTLDPPGATGGVAVARASGPATMACGKATCSLPEQVCCGDDRCAAAPAAPKADAMAYVQAVSEVCTAGGRPFTGFGACDDSGDCARGLRCCEQFTGSGESGYVACSDRCYVREVCVEGKACTKPGSACVGGTCGMAPERRRCGSGTCSRERPYCCGDGEKEPACSTSAECSADGMRHFECSSSRDCIEGACQRNVMGDVYCTLLVDIANAALVCEKDSDCDDSICMGSPGKGRCDTEEKSCVCDSP